MTTRYQELKDQRETLRKQLKEVATAHFREMASTIFAEHPTLEAFTWRQYTPYFNDGDECIFRACTDYPTLKFFAQPVDAEAEEPQDEDEDEDEDENEFYDRRGYAGKDGFPNTPQEKAGCAVVDFLGTFEDTDLKEMFGDHIRVTATRDAVNVEEYEHE